MTPGISLLLQTATPEVDVLAYVSLPHPESHPDVIWFNKESGPLTIDLVRQLQQDAMVKPYQSDRKVYILIQIEHATTEAQQALLKLLEEPPKHVQFLLTSAYPSMVLPTILSRVQLVGNDDQSAEQGSRGAAFTDFQGMSTAKKLLWASEFKTHEEATQSVLNLIQQQINQLETVPSLSEISRLRILEETLELLHFKTNVKLSMEELALKW